VIGLSRRVRVYAYTRPVDMRKQYDGLYALVVAELKADPLSGDLFLFTNRRRTRAKVLLWDGTGLCIYQKRLERGRFALLWRRDEQEVCELTPSELALFLEGSTLAGALRLSPPTTSPQVLTPFLHEAQRVRRRSNSDWRGSPLRDGSGFHPRRPVRPGTPVFVSAWSAV
jgi:transposase